MKRLRTLYHFLGGIYFALILIATVALFVIAGTFIESVTQSHRYAALFTYENPLFAALLWGFFINILFSATRRWPFQWKHIPFLITHFGLLMILAGVLAKHYYGLQGSMMLAEGTASQEIVETNTYAIHVDKKNGPSARYPLKKTINGNFFGEVVKNEEDVSIRLTEFAPHSTEHLASWVKGSYATINGLQPMPLYTVIGDEEELPISGRARFHRTEALVWDLYALKTSEIEKTLHQLYLQNARLVIKNRLSQDVVGSFSFESALKEAVNLNDGTSLKIDLSLGFSSLEGFQNPFVTATFDSKNRMKIPLSDDTALLNINLTTPHFGNLPWSLDIIRNPFLAVIEDEFDDVHLVAFDPYGKVWTKAFPKGSLDSLIANDNVISGYTAQAELPSKLSTRDRQTKEDVQANQLTAQFHQALTEKAVLAPPLQLLQKACEEAQVDFPETTTAFLTHWNACHNWLYPETTPLPPSLKLVFSKLDWNIAPSNIKQACEWTGRLFAQMDPDLKQGHDLLSILRKNHWPLLANLENESLDHDIFTLLTLQLFAASETLPLTLASTQPVRHSPETQANLLSGYLRAYDIHLSTIMQVPFKEEPDQEPAVNLEAAVVSIQKAIAPMSKLEDNLPKVTLYVNKGKRSQSISLSYEHTGSGLKWPVLDGEYLVRFQPQFKELPYKIRLRQARQINYANSSQPYSFESDLIITDKKANTYVEKTISMNKVHETWDGYRFYLSSISPPNETSIKHVQIVVNYDPAKYWLTYPGAIILSCGILMLFIMRPYRRTKQ